MAVESYTLKELEALIKDGNTYRLFKPFLYHGNVLLNLEKILTVKDILKLEGKVYGPIQVVSAVEHNTDDKIRKSIISNSINILKTSSLFKVDDVHHLDFTKRKECEKLLIGIIDGNPHLAQQLLLIYQHSKKLFIHSIKVGIIASVIDLGIQQKNKIHDGLESEELLTAALLHDIGFLTFPKSMVNKRRIEYNEEEKKLYKTYPDAGRKICLFLGDNVRKKTVDIVHQHQERLDGSGFPDRIAGNRIEELALIVGLADEFDLIISNEISTSKREPSEVISRISRMSKVFGSHIVDSFYTWFRYLR